MKNEEIPRDIVNSARKLYPTANTNPLADVAKNAYIKGRIEERTKQSDDKVKMLEWVNENYTAIGANVWKKDDEPNKPLYSSQLLTKWEEYKASLTPPHP